MCHWQSPIKTQWKPRETCTPASTEKHTHARARGSAVRMPCPTPLDLSWGTAHVLHHHMHGRNLLLPHKLYNEHHDYTSMRHHSQETQAPAARTTSSVRALREVQSTRGGRAARHCHGYLQQYVNDCSRCLRLKNAAPPLQTRLAGATRVRSIRIVAWRADCVKNRSLRMKVLCEKTKNLRGVSSSLPAPQRGFTWEFTLPVPPCKDRGSSNEKNMFFFELPRTTKVKKYFVAGITSPPKKKSH